MPDRREGVWWLLFHWRFTLILTVVFIVSLGHRGNNLLRLGLSLLLGGAFNNTYDRLHQRLCGELCELPGEMAGVPQDRLQLLGFLYYHRCVAIGAWNAVN